MNEEEAIERLKERVKLDRKIRNNKIESDYEQFCENECQAIETILNLADKQQKEIIRLNRKQADDEMLTDTFIERDYISKDKIREKIKYIKSLTFEENSITRDYILTILEELLEEN